jgi:hypothetical protein
MLGFQDDDQRTALVLSPNGTAALTPAEGCRKKAVTWCQKHCDPAAVWRRQSPDYVAYTPADFEPVRDAALASAPDGRELEHFSAKTSFAVPVLVSTRYVYRFVPTTKWVGEDGKPRNPLKDKLLSERGVSVFCSMVRTELRTLKRKVVTQEGEANGRLKDVNLVTRLGQQTLAYYHEFRHVVLTPLVDEPTLPPAARAVRAQLASLRASPYQVRVSRALTGASALVRFLEKEHDASRALALLHHDRKDERAAPDFARAREISARMYASTAGAFVQIDAAATGKRETMVGDEF